MHPSERDWAGFYQEFCKRTGIDLNLYKAGQMQRRVMSMVEQQGLADLPAFTKWIAANAQNLDWFLDKMAINVSELFRNPEKWEGMIKDILPELLTRTTRLKIWSAGCSYGAEAHTMAMILDHKFPGHHSVLGTDIDNTALAQAQRSEFSDSDLRCVPKEYRDKYLSQSGKVWVATPTLKKYLTFKKGNLLADRFDSGFDLIMCRNVVIYFTDEAKDALYQRFFDALKPGGILFVGSTERIFKSQEIGYTTPYPFYYQKPMLGDRKWLNAS